MLFRSVPLLVYVLHVGTDKAMPISLVAVSISAIVGGAQSIRRGHAVWQPTIIFAIGGVLGAPFGMLVAKRLAEAWIVGGFAALAITVGSLMWRAALVFPAQATAVRARTYPAGDGPICALAPDGQLRFSAPCAAVLAVIGLGTGTLAAYEHAKKITPAIFLAAISAMNAARRNLGRFFANYDVWLSPAFRSFDIREDCRRIQAPLLAIQGREDPYGSLQQIEDIRPLHGRIESCVLDHCGHAPQRDQSKASLARITSFLAACP